MWPASRRPGRGGSGVLVARLRTRRNHEMAGPAPAGARATNGWWSMARQKRRSRRTAVRLIAAGTIALAAGAAALSALPAAAAAAHGDRPAGFWYGTDSRTVSITGSAPYKEPVIGGSYGGYIGMTGNWANLENC